MTEKRPTKWHSVSKRAKSPLALRLLLRGGYLVLNLVVMVSYLLFRDGPVYGRDIEPGTIALGHIPLFAFLIALVQDVDAGLAKIFICLNLPAVLAVLVVPCLTRTPEGFVKSLAGCYLAAVAVSWLNSAFIAGLSV